MYEQDTVENVLKNQVNIFIYNNKTYHYLSLTFKNFNGYSTTKTTK